MMRNTNLYQILSPNNPQNPPADEWRYRLDYHVACVVELIREDNTYSLLNHVEQAEVVLDQAELEGVTSINTLTDLRTWFNGVADWSKLYAMRDDMPYAFTMLTEYILSTRPVRRPDPNEYTR